MVFLAKKGLVVLKVRFRHRCHGIIVVHGSCFYFYAFSVIISPAFLGCRLEPILARIKESPRTMICPMIDVISDGTLVYGGTGHGSAGGFWWSLHFKWISMTASERKRRKTAFEPYRYSVSILCSLDQRLSRPFLI